MEIPRERMILLAWCANTDPGPLTDDERNLYSDLLQHSIRKADAGDTGCQFDLGVKFAEGIFVSPDLEAAVDWWQRAAEGGHRDALECLAGVYWLGAGVEQDYRYALYLMAKAAEKGSPVAQFELARMHRHGLGTERNLTEAFKWFRAAASNTEEQQRYLKSYHERIGPADSLVKVPVFRDHDIKGAAQFETAEALANGRGVAQNRLLAKSWYEAAAARGHGLAQCELGMLLAQGIGGRDMAAAVLWWATAVGNGVAQAALNAAVAYAQGDGIPQNVEQAKEWAQIAANAGITSAFVMLGNLELEGAKTAVALQCAKDLYIRAAKAGDVDGQYSVGLACHRIAGMVLNENVVQMINAAYKGATTSTAQKQHSEEQVISHQKEALLWFYLAKENGSEGAPEMVTFLESHLGPETVRAVKADEPSFRLRIAAGEI